jgi:hypothetical protein
MHSMLAVFLKITCTTRFENVRNPSENEIDVRTRWLYDAVKDKSRHYFNITHTNERMLIKQYKVIVDLLRKMNKRETRPA